MRDPVAVVVAMDVSVEVLSWVHLACRAVSADQSELSEMLEYLVPSADVAAGLEKEGFELVQKQHGVREEITAVGFLEILLPIVPVPVDLPSEKKVDNTGRSSIALVGEVPVAVAAAAAAAVAEEEDVVDIAAVDNYHLLEVGAAAAGESS